MINNEKVERFEQLLSEIFISPLSKVLELSARYGTVSCIVNKRLYDPTKQVSVEPDQRVIKALEKNKKRNKCEFNIVYGTVSKNPVELSGFDVMEGYGTTGKEVESSPIPNYSVEQLEEKYGFKFDTLVADCEGCLEIFFNENKEFIKGLKMVFIKKDYPEKTNYNKIRNFLKRNNFFTLVGGTGSDYYQHEIWKKCKNKTGGRKTKRRKH